MNEALKTVQTATYDALKSSLNSDPNPVQKSLPSVHPSIPYAHTSPIKMDDIRFHAEVTIPSMVGKIANTADDAGAFLSYNFARGGDFWEPILYVVGFLIVAGLAVMLAGTIISILVGGVILYGILKLIMAALD